MVKNRYLTAQEAAAELRHQPGYALCVCEPRTDSLRGKRWAEAKSMVSLGRCAAAQEAQGRISPSRQSGRRRDAGRHSSDGIRHHDDHR